MTWRALSRQLRQMRMTLIRRRWRNRDATRNDASVGAWGPGLWSDDTATDVRATYREALEDGMSDDAAAEKVLGDFASDLGDADTRSVVWLALAAAQSTVGRRLRDDVRAQALRAIDSGENMRLWEHLDARTVAKRGSVLAKLREQLVAEPKSRKAVRRPARPQTALTPGDVVSCTAVSGRVHLLAVRAIHESRYAVVPVVELLDYAEPALPSQDALDRLQARAKGRKATGTEPAEPWWSVGGAVMHKKGSDFADLGFTLIGRVRPLSAAPQTSLSAAPENYSSWHFWKAYLEKQDTALGERQSASPKRRLGRRTD
jgi:hypothetical protein